MKTIILTSKNSLIDASIWNIDEAENMTLVLAPNGCLKDKSTTLDALKKAYGDFTFKEFLFD